MTKRMLIDASHPEETRVAIIDHSKLEEFDFESTNKLPLKGNIYLAKVVRVEPSLQAAFVEYGGGRHGFLAFNEIHPDYFRIPVSDREKLEELERASAPSLFSEDKENLAPSTEESSSNDSPMEKGTSSSFLRVIDTSEESPIDENFSEVTTSTFDGEDSEIDSARMMQSSRVFHKKYKIQEVIKSRQILLIQVVKEERGTKGAALTTYISLAGRYCVLMPNALRGGGISRKITDAQSRKRLRSLLEDLDLPSSMGVIVRTAGMERTKSEIKRDLDYLLKLWNDIRELTLKSTAPSLIYREGDLIKRTLRDFYSKDIEEVIIEGESAYHNAKDFMRLLMPSHVKRVRLYRDEALPLFRKFKIEEQIDEMHNPVVQLKSGGYIVINPTEALTAIDVNSGRSNRERHIDETALRTNLEAAEETARQIRLRDLAGLIVIDFIDMSDPRSNANVERRLRDSMKDDRARTQLGRISPFGLLELSRQRLRPNLLEASSIPCPHCRGTGLVRSTESLALHILRSLEEGIKMPHNVSSEISFVDLTIHTSKSVASYLLNQKRLHLVEIEKRFPLHISILEDEDLISPDFRIVSPYFNPPSDEKTPIRGNKETQKRPDHTSRLEDTSETASGQDISENSTTSRNSSKRRNRHHKRKAHSTLPLKKDLFNEPTGSSEKILETPSPLQNEKEHQNKRTPYKPKKQGVHSQEHSLSEDTQEAVLPAPRDLKSNQEERLKPAQKKSFSHPQNSEGIKHTRSFRNSPQKNGAFSSESDQNFTVLSHPQEEAFPFDVSSKFPKTGAESEKESTPIRTHRKTRYPLAQARERRIKNLNSQEKNPTPQKEQRAEKNSVESSSQDTPTTSLDRQAKKEVSRKGWWQRLLE